MVRAEALPPPLGTPIHTGHFRMGRAYSCLRDRGTGDWLLMATVAGRGRVGWRGGEALVEAGDVVLLRPDAFHDYGTATAPGRWELLWLHVQPRPDWLDLLDWPALAPGLHHLHLPADARAGLFARFAELHRLASGALRQRTRLAMCACEDLLLRLDLHNPRSQQARIDARVRAALDHLCANLDRRIVAADLARACGLSVSRLARLFRAQVGSTPQRFLEERRLERARHLLSHTALPVQDIAAATGFASPFYFSVRFRRATGASPRAWRRRQPGRTR